MGCLEEIGGHEEQGAAECDVAQCGQPTVHGHVPVAYAACSCPEVHEAVLRGRLGGWLLALSFFFMGLLGTPPVGTWQFLTPPLAPAALHGFPRSGWLWCCPKSRVVIGHCR